MSPLRYQKWLRLNEVRRPMLNEHYDVTTAAYAVGHEYTAIPGSLYCSRAVRSWYCKR